MPDWDARYDNVRVDGQVVLLEQPLQVSALHVLGVGEGFLGKFLMTPKRVGFGYKTLIAGSGFLQHNPPQNITLNFADGSTDMISVETKQWYDAFLCRESDANNLVGGVCMGPNIVTSLLHRDGSLRGMWTTISRKSSTPHTISRSVRRVTAVF